MTVVAQSALEINQTLRIDIRMQVGKVSDAVTVEGLSSMVETENTVGATVSGVAIYVLPLNGRNTLDWSDAARCHTHQSRLQVLRNYSIGGQRTDSVTYLLDGGKNNSLLGNDVVATRIPTRSRSFAS